MLGTASPKLSPLSTADVIAETVLRIRPKSGSLASSSNASSMRAPVRSSSAKSPLKIVTSSGLGLETKEKNWLDAGLASRFSLGASIGISLRYSMRICASRALAATSEPLTTSPTCVSAR